jgi:formylglycine-generating enzyme required for sulfatase activity
MAMPSEPDQLAALWGWYQSFRQARGDDFASVLEVADWLWLTAKLREAPICSGFSEPENPSSGAAPQPIAAPAARKATAGNAVSADTPSSDASTPREKPQEPQPESSPPKGNPKPPPTREAAAIPLLSPAALPDQRDVTDSLQSYSDWLVANGGEPLRLQAPPLFPSALALLKPLKPLLIPRFSLHQLQLDEERSAERSAELGIVWPVFRPGRLPGLRVRLVLDAGMSMEVWRPHAEELKRVLASSQSFDEVILEPLPLEQLEAAVKHERRLSSPVDGCAITLLISDTAGLHWWDHRIQPWLEAVGARQPMAVIHTLPYRYRGTTALSQGFSVTLYSQSKLGTNATYRKKINLLRGQKAEEKQHPVIFALPNGAVIPVISLNPREIRPWAALVMGNHQARCPGIVFPPPSIVSSKAPPPSMAKPCAEDLLKGFLGVASSEAQMLLSWMAGSPAPLTLGVLRLLQGALRQEGNTAQPLAEVMVSGLLERLPGQKTVQFEELQFHVIPEVRSLLLVGLDPAARQTVLHLVTQMLERHWNRRGKGPSFEALITDPNAVCPTEGMALIHVADITASMLDKLPIKQFHEIGASSRMSQPLLQARRQFSSLVNRSKTTLQSLDSFDTFSGSGDKYGEGDVRSITARSNTPEWCWPIAWDFLAYRNEKRKGFAGRQWLFEEVRRWAQGDKTNSDSANALLISADYGMGKSAFLAELIDANATGLPVAAQHFCRADMEPTLSPSVFVRSIAAQFAEYIPAYRHAIEKDQALDLRHHLDNSDRYPNRAFEMSVLEPLLSIEVPPSKMLLVVDALDESEAPQTVVRPDERITILRLLATYASRLPHWLKLLATCRRLPNVTNALRHDFCIKDLNADDARNVADLHAYVAVRCQTPTLAERLKRAQLNAVEVADFLSAPLQSGGMFLYVVQVLDDLEAGQLPLTNVNDLKSLGQGLGGFYLNVFKQRYPTDEIFSPVRDVLGVLCEAGEPLERHDLAGILQTSEDEITAILYPIRDFLRIESVAFENKGIGLTGVMYSLVHSSLALWLSHKGYGEEMEASRRFMVDRLRAAQKIHLWAVDELKAKRNYPSPYLRRYISKHAEMIRHDLFDLYRSSFAKPVDGKAIFISYTGRDAEGDAWADRLAGWFEEWEYGYFRDKDHSHGIKAGVDWRQTLYRELGLARALVCLCSKQYEVSPWCVGEVAIAVKEGKTVIPIQLAETEEELQTQPLPLLLQAHQAIKVTSAALPTPEQLAEVKQRLRQTLQRKLNWRDLQSWDATLPPYPGLPAFEERQAPVFFGRDAAIEAVVERLSSLALRAPGFLLLLGASGIGKSSLIRAGIIPKLQGESERRWLVVDPFRSGPGSISQLYQQLDGIWRELGETSPNIVNNESAEDGLIRWLYWLQISTGATVLLVIDQFEELLSPELQPESVQFLGFLQALLQSKPNDVVVLAALRSDFFVKLQSLWPILTAMASFLALEPIAQDHFRELISGPAKRSGLTLQPGLADRLMTGIGNQDALPLLAFTLEKLWRRHIERGGPVVGTNGALFDLTLADYEALGGVAGAVSSQAKLCWNPETSHEADTAALREAFLDHLVTLNEEGQAAKRPAPLRELPERSRPIVERMVNRRLLVSDAGVVEIAHEALLRTWEPLVAWIEEGKVELLQCLRVRRLLGALTPEAPAKDRRKTMNDLADLAAAGGSEGRAVQKEAAGPLAALLAEGTVPEADRLDAALVLALVGAEAPLSDALADTTAPVAVRRRAAESLGLLAKRSGDQNQRDRIAAELEGWLRSDVLEVRIEPVSDPALLAMAREPAKRKVAAQVAQARAAGQLETISEAQLLQAIPQMEDQATQQELWAMGASPGWAEHDALLPLLQGAARGLQLAASADLPLLGSGPGRKVPMLTLRAEEEGGGLRIRTEVVEVPVWQLPLPTGEPLELVLVPAGERTIGSPAEEAGRDVYILGRQKCEGVDVEVLRKVRLVRFALLRHPISQGQWRAVVESLAVDQRGELNASPGTFRPDDAWERCGQPGGLPVDSVSWTQCQQWLEGLNGWLAASWPQWAEQHPELGPERVCFSLPSESQWEAACRAGDPSPFHFGATLDPSWARYDASRTYAKGRRGDNLKRPVSLGFFGLVNRWGLAELHGQLAEWYADQWHPSPIGASEAQRPGWLGGGGTPPPLLDGRALEGPDPGLAEVPLERGMRLLRGGSCFVAPHGCRAAYRGSLLPAHFNAGVGLRPCCLLPPGPLLGP